MSDWISVAEKLPPENKIVDTRIDDGKYKRNEQPLKRRGNLWHQPDGSMYVYYTPTHWRWPEEEDYQQKVCEECALWAENIRWEQVASAQDKQIDKLQAENEKLRNEVERQRRSADDRQHLYENAERAYIKAQTELEQVRQERDAVLNAFRGFIQSGHLCEYCAETLKDNPACSACEKWSKFQWRGVGEDT